MARQSHSYRLRIISTALARQSHNTKTRLNFCHQLARLYTTKLPTLISTTSLQQCSMPSTYDSLLRTALALQQLAYVRLAVRASNQIDTHQVNPTYCQNREIDLPTTTDLSYPQRSSCCIQRHDRPQLPATIVQLHSTTRSTSASRNDRPAAFYDSTDLRCPQRSSSCILRLDRPQLPATIVQLHSTTQPTATHVKHLAVSPRPTPATLIEHPAAHIYDSTIPAIDITHQAEDPNTTATDFTHALVSTTINCHLCYICYLAFVSFVVFGCHYSYA